MPTFKTEVYITFPNYFATRLQALLNTFKQILENHDFTVVVDRGVKYSFACIETIQHPANKMTTTQ